MSIYGYRFIMTWPAFSTKFNFQEWEKEEQSQRKHSSKCNRNKISLPHPVQVKVRFSYAVVVIYTSCGIKGRSLMSLIFSMIHKRLNPESKKFTGQSKTNTKLDILRINHVFVLMCKCISSSHCKYTSMILSWRHPAVSPAPLPFFCYQGFSGMFKYVINIVL